MSRKNIPWPVQTPEELDALATAWGADYALKPEVKEHLGSPEAPPRDNVNLPQHYARHKIEPIRFLMENEVDGFQFNIIKYVMRHRFKNRAEDLKKALRYLEMYLKKEYVGDPDWWKPTTMSIVPGVYP